MRIHLLGCAVGFGACILAGPSAAHILFSTPGLPGTRDATTDEIQWLRDAAPGDAVALQLPGIVATGALGRSIHRSPESFSWYGLLSEPLGEFQVTVHRGRIVAVVSAPGLGSFEIRAGGNGGPRVRELDSGDQSGCKVVVPPEQDYAEPSRGRGGPDDGSVIDVLVAYTPGAKNEAGGTAEVEAVIVAAMDQANFSYANSGVTPRLRLVHMAELSYTESGDCFTDLDHYQDPYDGFMDEVLPLRDSYGADLCALITESGNCCGIAYQMVTPALGFANFAFSVTVLSCALGHTFVHELGHNLGACHAVGDGDVNCQGSYSYSVGHRFVGNSGTEWRTVMAYYPGIRVSHFSNPDTLFDGVATGVPIGQPGEAHNAATLDSTAWHGANFRRPSVCNDSTPSVTLIAPNGGELLCPGTSQTVSWTSSDEFFYNFVVELSTDGGSSWAIQGEGSRAGSAADFAWTVPSAPTADGRVRVTITNCAGSASDASDQPLELASAVPEVTLQTFTGGETVCAATNTEIVWASTGSCEATSWSVDYSTDTGGSWSEIAAGSGTGGGSQPWLVPDTPTGLARVRVILSSPAGADSASSSSDFTILPPGSPSVTVQSPDGGEVWAVATEHPISWSNSGCAATVTTIRYSSDGGATFSVLHTANGVDPGVYLWTVPGIVSDQALVSVTQYGSAGGDVDTSDATFSIVGPPQASLSVPTGGEIWVAGTTHAIRWTNGGGSATSHTIEYSTNGGAGWSPIVQNVPGPGGSFDWTVPASPTPTARVRISLDNEAGADTTESPGDFAIAAVADFVDVTAGVLTQGGTSRGVAWGDWDDDGDDDLLVTTSLSGNVFLNNDGFGDFTNATTAPIENVGADSYGAAWADWDEDGDRDVYLVSGSSANVLLRNDSGSFTDVTAAPLDDAQGGRTGTWADSDLDGDLDLYLVNQIGTNALFRNDDGSFVDATTGPLGDASLGSSASWSDYDLDGDPDLYVVNFGANKLLRNDGANSFTDVTSGPVGDPLAGLGASWADFDDDGDPDLYVTNTGANVLLRNDLGSGFADATSGPLGEASWTNGAAWADFDLDGDLDLYLANQGAANLLLRNDGGGTFVDATPAALADAENGQGVAWADANADGTPDLYLANSDGASRHFQNYAGAGRHWLHVDLVGTVSSTDAVGAKIRVVVGGVSRHREVAAGSGWLSQDSRRAVFGLDAASTVDTVEVRWTSGVVQALDGVGADQVLTVVEPDPTPTGPVSARPTIHWFAPPAPNPFRRATSIRFDLPAAGLATLRVYDVSGRFVRTVVDRRLEPGRHRTTWDGRDSGGRVVASGIYFVRMRAGDFTATRRILRLR